MVERVTAENNREKWAQKAEQMKPKDLDYRLELEIQEADEEYRKMAQAGMSASTFRTTVEG
eukprot:COSAG04_NODE_13055_length_622_cov_0.856597_2_plen_61_part_00